MAKITIILEDKPDGSGRVSCVVDFTPMINPGERRTFAQMLALRALDSTAIEPRFMTGIDGSGKARIFKTDDSPN